MPSGAEWKALLSDLLHDCAASAPVEQADRIREAQELIRETRSDAGRLAGSSSDRRVIEAMLALGAHESAVLAIIGSETAFMLSRGANGNCLASVALPDGSEEVVAEGSTMALALLAAYLSTLLADAELAPDEALLFHAPPGMRFN